MLSLIDGASLSCDVVGIVVAKSRNVESALYELNAQGRSGEGIYRWEVVCLSTLA
jgi:hypothetical protein